MRLSLGYQVILAVLLALFCGIFFGPLCNIFQPIGQIYVMLLQMVALPYVCFSLIHGLGSISPQVGKKLFLRGWPFWLTLWGLIFVLIFFADWLIPKPLVAYIGNENARAQSFEQRFLSTLVPKNPIYDLANNVLPALTIFGLIVGCALMHLEKKEPILSLLDRSNETIEKIFKWLAILSPIGIFAHLAVASGTVYFEDLYALQFYVIAYVLIALFVTVWVLPALLSSLTPLSYSEALQAMKTVCFLPFATALPSIALPFIHQYMKKLGEQHAKADPQFQATSQTVMPICYSFGQIGNCLILFFIFFLSFYFRHPFFGIEKWLVSLLVIPVSLGSSATSINAATFLLNWLNFSDRAVELYTQTSSVTLNFQVLLSVASVLTLVILVLYSYYDLLQIKWKMLFCRLGSALSIMGLVVLGAKQMVHVRDNYQNLYGSLSIDEAIEHPVPSKILMEGETGVDRGGGGDSQLEPLGSILRAGVLKVGFDPQNIPYAYFNDNQQLVGYDIAYAYQLARDLDCVLEFVPIHLSQMGQELAQFKYDIGMSALLMNEERLRDMDFTHPYAEQNNVLIVPMKERAKFTHLSEVIDNPSLRIGAIGGYIPVTQRHFPLAKVVAHKTDAADAFQNRQIDAYMWSHIPGFVWSLSHPDYVEIDYGGLIGKQYFAYTIRIGSFDWGSFLNNWLILKEQAGFKDKMYQYWIKGETSRKRKERWSVLRNVF